MWCGVLGPLVARTDSGAPITISGPARRLLFAALVSRAGSVVSAGTLIEDIWGRVPPRSAGKTLQSHMVRLRHDLGRAETEAVLVTEPSGYRLALGVDSLDATQFVTGVAAAGQLLAQDDTDGALQALDAALELWRGDAFEEFADAPFCVGERLRLFELRAHAEEQRTDIALALGQAAELVADLEKRVAAAPYRERSWEQLIIALYRAGRQADALGAYRRARAVLAEDLGVDPGPRLQLLEQQVLQQDPTLLATPAPRPGTRPRPGRRNVCPYRGLASYTDADSELFVGRERLTAELVGRLAEHRVVAVVGASGVGKSSLVRAGLLTALRGGALPGSAAWRSAALTPASLREMSIGDLDVLVLDQAEDLFLQLSAVQRAEAVDRIEQFGAAGGRVVLALRGDFYGRLAELQPLAAHAEAATVLVGPLREDELRRVVEEPAARVGLTIETDLVETVLDDVTGQPLALPLLSAALVRTWENREGDALTLAGYRRGGGVVSALEAMADEVYQQLPDAQRITARRLFVRMAEREGASWVRRPVRRAEALAEPDGDLVLSRLADARLVTVAQERVEITHDALLVHWPRLRGWLEERVLAAELLDHLSTAAHAWREAGRQASDLYRGARLRAALDWRTEHPDDVSGGEAEFLDASAAAADAELHEARAQTIREARGRRRLRIVAAALAVAAVLALAGVVVAARERDSADQAASRAEAAALTADARRLAALSVTAPDIATSSLLAAAAYRLQDSPDTRGALLSAVQRNQAALFRLRAPHRLLRLAVTPDGRYAAANDNRGNVLLYDIAARRVTASVQLGPVFLSAITADGSGVVVITLDGPDAGRVALVDVPSGAVRQVLTSEAVVDGPEPVMSPDGRWLAVPVEHDAIQLFDARDWAGAPRTLSVRGGAASLTLARDALGVRGFDGTVDVRRLPSLRSVVQASSEPGEAAGPTGVTLSPDGSRLAVIGNDGFTVAVLDRPGFTHRIELPTQSERISVVAFSPDGADIAVDRFDGAMAVYRAADGSLITTLPGHTGPSFGMAWAAGSAAAGLFSVGLDSDFVAWDVSAGPRLVRESGPTLAAPDRSARFGNYVVGLTPYQGGPASAARLLVADLRTGSWSSWPLGLADNDYVNQIVASDDGRRALVSVQDGDRSSRVEIWDLRAKRQVGELELPADSAQRFDFGFNAAISADGSRAYSSLGTHRVGVFALPEGRYLRSFTISFAGPHGADVFAVPWRFDPKGRLIVAGVDLAGADEDQRLALVSPASGEVLAQGSLGDVSAPTTAAWAPNGGPLAVGTLDGTVSLYDPETLAPVGSAGAIEPGFVNTLSFAPDGRTLVSAGTSGALVFLAVPELTRVGGRIPVGAGANNGGMFAWYAPDGSVAGFAPDLRNPAPEAQRWFTFSADPGSLVRTACDLAGSDMTRAQWRRYLGDRPYQPVCPA